MPLQALGGTLSTDLVVVNPLGTALGQATSAQLVTIDLVLGTALGTIPSTTKVTIS